MAASQRLIQMQAEIDKINIFPVPDGDTGTNMALTMRSVADGVLNCEDASLHEISAMLAKSALAHAHGSSGAILAQFFKAYPKASVDKQSAISRASPEQYGLLLIWRGKQ